MIEEAKSLAKAFFEEASVDSDGKGRHVHFLVQVRQASENSWSILWVRNLAAPGKPAVLRTVHKGVGTRYPAGTFNGTKEPLKGLCRAYESRLAQIREACQRNRALRRTALAHGQQVLKVLSSS